MWAVSSSNLFKRSAAHSVNILSWQPWNTWRKRFPPSLSPTTRCRANRSFFFFHRWSAPLCLRISFFAADSIVFFFSAAQNRREWELFYVYLTRLLLLFSLLLLAFAFLDCCHLEETRVGCHQARMENRICIWAQWSKLTAPAFSWQVWWLFFFLHRCLFCYSDEVQAPHHDPVPNLFLFFLFFRVFFCF